MSSVQTNNTDKHLSLKDAAQMLAVSKETLIEWNDSNILKPTVTQDGQVVYPQSQIEKFLAIYRLSQNNQSTLQAKPSGFVVETEKHLSYPTANTNESSLSKGYYETESKRLRIIAASSAFAVVLTFVTVTFITHKNTSVNFDSETSRSANVSNETINNLDSLQENNEKSAVAAFVSIPEDNRHSVTEEYLVQPSPVGDQFGTVPLSASASRANVGTEDQSLAINLTAMESSQKKGLLSQGFSFNILIAFLALGMLSLAFALRRQFAFQTNIANFTTPSTPGMSNSPYPRKVLEVNQKTDGAVVVSFQGREFKISKPELSSESDQFIERLITRTGVDEKEINYDILDDSDFKLKTPLSRLVTRLGFVGLKRELFFPRTSKNMVLFRKYLTSEDLSSMGITLEQISDEFLN